MKLTDIDPALGLLPQFGKIAHGTTAALQTLRESTIYRDGVFPARTKALAALLWSIAARCEPCVKYYAAKARELGATEAEAGEFLALASTMGGCVGETWAVKAYAAFKQPPGGEACCS
jgi:AhpD family alkylhydroperoxidase